MEKIRTAECVSPGHPDKVCDQISDAILDAYLAGDPTSRVAVEVAGGHGKLFISGEVTSKTKVDLTAIAKKVYMEIGYQDSLEVLENLVCQSPDICQGVDTGGAGDQGIMIGYACNENEAMIPQELYLARTILKNLPKEFGPDAKAQVTLNNTNEIETIVISAQHQPNQEFSMLHKLGESHNPKKLLVNPTGAFTLGGFTADAGLTGRKIVVDAYGPQIPVGGGAFSGKDATKVDRSAAYMARKVAVDLVKNGKAKNALVKIAYSIGVAEPVMAIAILDGRREVDVAKLGKYDLRPRGIIDFLGLTKPIFRQTAAWGHFGNGFAWDK